jgi:predicted Zn-dependent peptidase
MLDRTISPELKEIEQIHFAEPEIISLRENLQLIHQKHVFDETVRLELHFNAGQIQGDLNVASLVSSLLLSGTDLVSSKEIHESLDALGAYVEPEISMEMAFINLYCLRKNVNEALKILVNAIENASFPEHEIKDNLDEKKQSFLVNNEKVSYLARREFQKQLFSNSEKYNRLATMEDFEKDYSESIKKFHKEFYLNGLMKVVLVANLGEDFISELKNKLQNFSVSIKTDVISELVNKQGLFKVEKKGTVQTAIRIGFPLFNKTHDDFFDFQIMQTIFGDYFGSRLMSNIREDKGYTYGIGTALVEMFETGYFIIVTEVGKEVADLTIKEIKVEIDKLKAELVDDTELELVKNYILGQLLKSADGPNAMMDLFLSAQQQGLTLEFYNDYIERVKSINAGDIQKMAQKYLIWEKFTVVTAGEHN